MRNKRVTFSVFTARDDIMLMLRWSVVSDSL